MKKISISNNSVTIKPQINLVDCNISYWDYFWSVLWSAGYAEEGSSGAPLFDNNHRVIGTLTGNGTTCPPEIMGFGEYFGRICDSWNGNGSATRLKDWLDPDNTGANTLNGYCSLNPNIQNVTYSSTTTVNSCAKLNLTNVTINNNAKVTFNTNGNGIVINGTFKAIAGSTLQINK